MNKSPQKFGVWDLLKVILALVLLGFVISTTDLEQIKKLWYAFSPAWLGVTFLLFAVMTSLKALQFYVLVGGKLRYSRVLGIIILQNAVTNFVASAAGIASQLTLMAVEDDVKFGRAAFSFIIAKVGDLAAVAVLLFFSSLWVGSQAGPTRGVVVTLLATTVIFLMLFLLVLFFRARFVALLTRIFHFLRIDRFRFIQRGIGLLEELAAQDRGKILRLLMFGVGYSMIYMVATMIWAYARFRTFSLTIDLGVITYVVSILQYTSWFPILVFGGLGITETLSVYLYGTFGADKPQLAAILLGSRVVFYLMNAVSLLYVPIDAMAQNRNRTSRQ